ncbi:MAG: type I restriction enzyme HsdR N-terminal domain-containing protein, partial [Vicingaceae bacterium]|nr:type I restriction enzyme HsdR N-terminal domain-containing protein [Vicingaceae bacterium]
MQQLNLPQHTLKIKEENGTHYIFDFIRKKYLVLQPEEWVRQNFIQFLVNDKNYAASLIAIEKGLKLNELQKRADIVIYDSQAKPIVLIECKAPKVKINQEVFEQIARYNMVFKVPYLIVTNGLEH